MDGVGLSLRRSPSTYRFFWLFGLTKIGSFGLALKMKIDFFIGFHSTPPPPAPLVGWLAGWFVQENGFAFSGLL
jgi:hypothetical protein